MAVTTNDIQPKMQTITHNGTQYTCKVPSVSHKMIIAGLQPFFLAIAEISEGKKSKLNAAELLEAQNEIDALLNDLVPDMKNVTLNENDLVEIITQILQGTNTTTEQAVADNKIEAADSDPKVPETTKRTGT